MSRTPEYQAYKDAKRRCNDPLHRNFRHYGGRGITFDFDSFESFIADIGPKPSPDLSLDRINNNEGYRPGNIRWATQFQQISNRRNKSIECHEAYKRRQERKIFEKRLIASR